MHLWIICYVKYAHIKIKISNFPSLQRSEFDALEWPNDMFTLSDCDTLFSTVSQIPFPDHREICKHIWLTISNIDIIDLF